MVPHFNRSVNKVGRGSTFIHHAQSIKYINIMTCFHHKDHGKKVTIKGIHGCPFGGQ